MIEEIYDKTDLISAVEKEQLLNIKNERNYVAHPIIDFNSEKLELKLATKETAKDLIRKGFEIVFLKDALLGKNLISDIIDDLNVYYDRAGSNGLEIFLKSKYFKRMNQERKDNLFKTLWKFIFILDDDDCNKNRKANYWGLCYLYREDKEHCKDIIRNDEDYYFTKLSIELFTVTDGVNLQKQLYEYNNSRVMTLVRFIEENCDIYKIFNEHAKNILVNTIDKAFMQYDIKKTKLCQVNGNESSDVLFKYQLILKAQALFLEDDAETHFGNIENMIKNYCATRSNYYEGKNYDVLGEAVLKKIFVQAEYRGAERQFIKFLISYCMNASSFYQAECMIEYIEPYIEYFTEEDFFLALAKMSENVNYTDNHNIKELRGVLEKGYEKKFGKEILKDEQERYLYPKLYKVNPMKFDGNYDEILKRIEEKVKNYDAWSFWNNVLEPLIRGMEEKKLHFNGNIDNYKNILFVLNSEEEIKWSIKELEGVFVSQ